MIKHGRDRDLGKVNKIRCCQGIFPGQTSKGEEQRD